MTTSQRIRRQAAERVGIFDRGLEDEMMRPRVGDTAWAVDWCADLPVTPEGDADIDGADYRREFLPDRDSAIARARELLPSDAFGAVCVVEVEFVPYDDADAALLPHVGHWEELTEGEYVEA